MIQGIKDRGISNLHTYLLKQKNIFDKDFVNRVLMLPIHQG